jgi:hypothetical protein
VLVGLAAAGLLALHALAASLVLSGDPADPERARELVHLRVGSHAYAIPRGYISAIRRGEDGEVTRVMMRGIWPEMDPLSAADPGNWQRRHPERQIIFHLAARPRLGYRKVAYYRNDNRSQKELWKYGLTKHSIDIRWLFTPTDKSYTDPVGLPMGLSCLLCPKRGLPDSLMDPEIHKNIEPVLKVDYELFSGAEGVHYHYFFVNIAEWREIDGTIRDLVDGFRQGG